MGYLKKLEPITLKGEEVLPYTVIKNGITGIETKLCNFDHPGVCPREGRIELKYINNRKKNAQPDCSFTTFVDSQTGIRYGIPVGTDKNGDIVYRRIRLSELHIYDLSNISDAKEWAIVRMAHFVKSSPLSKGLPMYEVIDHEEKAIKEISDMTTISKLYEIVSNLNELDMIEFASVVPGIDVENNSPSLIKGLLAEKIRKSPAYVMQQWENENRKVLVILKRGVATGQVNYDYVKGFTTATGMPIGDTELSAVSFLKKNTQLLFSIDFASKKISKHRDLMTKSDNDQEVREAEKSKEVLFDNELAKKLEASMAKTDRLEKMLEKFLSANNSTETKEVSNAEEAPEEKSVVEKGKYSEIQIKARLAGVKQWHLRKDEDLLAELNKKNEVKTF